MAAARVLSMRTLTPGAVGSSVGGSMNRFVKVALLIVGVAACKAGSERNKADIVPFYLVVKFSEVNFLLIHSICSLAALAYQILLAIVPQSLIPPIPHEP